MRKRLLPAFIIFAALLFLLFRIRSEADLIPHHGMKVNPDSAAAECLSCHNGSVASPVPFCTVQCNFNSPHSIERPYPPPDKADEYVPLEQLLQAGVKLERGRVSCISCHNLRNNSRHHLVVQNTRSRLCVTCHIK